MKTEKNSVLFHFREWNFNHENVSCLVHHLYIFVTDFHERSFLYKIISNYNHSHQFREWNYMYKNVTSGPS